MVRLKRIFLLLTIALPLMHISSSLAWNWPWTRPANFIKSAYSKNPIPVIATIAGLIGSAILINSVQNKKINLNSLNVKTFTHDGAIPDKDKQVTIYPGLDFFNPDKNIKTIIIMVPGFMYGQPDLGIKSARQLKTNGAFPTHHPQQKDEHEYHNLIPCVTFDFFDNRRLLNLGQNLDQKCLQYVIDQVAVKCPQANIIIYASCRGAKTVLELLAHKQTNDYPTIKAIILDEPLNPDLTFSLRLVGLNILKFLLPNYRTKASKISHAKIFPTYIPIFIGTLKNDPATCHMNEVVHKLKGFGCVKLQHQEFSDTIEVNGKFKKLRHGFLSANFDYIRSIHSFLKQHGLPYYE